MTQRAPRNYVWSERWLGSAALPRMSLRALHDDIWLRGRLLDTTPDSRVLLAQAPPDDLLSAPIGEGRRLPG